MRKFRSNGVNIRDARISHIFLIALAVLCVIMGAVTEWHIRNASETGMSAARITLEGCRDSLRQWVSAQSDEERYKAAVRFESISSGLPHPVKLETLGELASRMKEGDADADELQRIADIFARLAASEHSDGALTREHIAAEINGIFEPETVTENAELSDNAPIPYEVLSYTRKVVENSIHRLFEGHEGSIEPKLSENSTVWNASADNVRMSFNAETGQLEEFTFIRLGHPPETALDTEKKLDSVRTFYSVGRRCDAPISAEPEGELGGFLSVLVTDSDGSYRVSVDRHGRVWSFMKVKR